MICAYWLCVGAMDNATQMMLARAMSIPLATVLFQSLMGGQQMAAPPVFQPPPVMQPASQSPSAMMNPALLQMMQQAFQVLFFRINFITCQGCDGASRNPHPSYADFMCEI